MRSSPRSSRAACVLALTTAIVGVVEVSAHRRDEYLQAARLAIDPDGVQLELDLTPGIALAEAIIADIDRNRDGVLSQDEQRDYADSVARVLALEVDETPVRPQLGVTSFPDLAAMRLGEGTIRLHSTATFPRLSTGRHQLLFRNGHDPVRSVYLANALVPASNTVVVTAQRRDTYQTELTIDYVLRAGPATSTDAWLLGSTAAAMVVVLGIRRSRSRGCVKKPGRKTSPARPAITPRSDIPTVSISRSAQAARPRSGKSVRNGAHATPGEAEQPDNPERCVQRTDRRE